MRVYHFLWLPALLTAMVMATISGGCMSGGWVRGGLIEPDSVTYVNDVHGIRLVIDPVDVWDLQLSDLGSNRQTEYYEVELLRGYNRRSKLNLDLTLIYLQGDIRSTEDYYRSRRIRLMDKQSEETFERVEIGAYPVWRWRYN
ncbi:hypothetical protein ACFLT7_08525, partial [candidate division KSB1 bacterium]